MQILCCRTPALMQLTGEHLIFSEHGLAICIVTGGGRFFLFVDSGKTMWCTAGSWFFCVGRKREKEREWDVRGRRGDRCGEGSHVRNT